MISSASRSSHNMGRAVFCMIFDCDLSFSNGIASGGPDMLGIREKLPYVEG